MEGGDNGDKQALLHGLCMQGEARGTGRQETLKASRAVGQETLLYAPIYLCCLTPPLSQPEKVNILVLTPHRNKLKIRKFL